MILVVADDFTGAAELAGVAWRQGLSAELQTRLDLTSSAQLIALDTETRSRPAAQAARRLNGVARRIRQSPPPRLLYKKIDSLLRGPFLAEVQALLQRLGPPRALLVPANPGLGRTIEQGCYLVAGRPIHETDLGRDPERSLASSRILDMISPGPLPIQLLSPGQPLPARGICLGQAATGRDLAAWRRRLDDQTLPGGAAEFFACLLADRKKPAGRAEKKRTPSPPAPPAGQTLLISGSAASRAWEALQRLQRRKVPVLFMPRDLFRNPSRAARAPLRRWSCSLSSALEIHSCAAVAIGPPLRPEPELGPLLARHLVQVVKEAPQARPIRHLWVEGGATASLLVRRLGWKRLPVAEELAPGVVSLQIPGSRPLCLTVKPGSYEWPLSLMGPGG